MIQLVLVLQITLILICLAYSFYQGVPYPSIPRKKAPKRVDLYYSCWVIRAGIYKIEDLALFLNFIMSTEMPKYLMILKQWHQQEVTEK